MENERDWCCCSYYYHFQYYWHRQIDVDVDRLVVVQVLIVDEPDDLERRKFLLLVVVLVLSLFVFLRADRKHQEHSFDDRHSNYFDVVVAVAVVARLVKWKNAWTIMRLMMKSSTSLTVHHAEPALPSFSAVLFRVFAPHNVSWQLRERP